MRETATSAAIPAVGDTLGGKYRIVGKLGDGGMGVVVEAEHLRLPQRVAIKFLQPELFAKPDIVARFEREGRAAARLTSRHVVRVLDVDVTPEGLPYIVMERLVGNDLGDELEARGPLSLAETIEHMLSVCSAMVEAHGAGIVHRDLKPSNIFLCKDREGRIAKVLDFGISKVADEGGADVTSTEAQLGTPRYMSPEQVRSSKHVDARTDIWSLGVIAYELLTGQAPFFAQSPTATAAAIVADPPPPMGERRPDLPKALEAVILKALEKNAADRYPDVNSFACALAPFGTSLAREPWREAGDEPAVSNTKSVSRATLTRTHPATREPTPPPSTRTLAHEAAGSSARDEALSASTGEARGRRVRASVVALSVAALAVVALVLVSLPHRGPAGALVEPSGAQANLPVERDASAPLAESPSAAASARAPELADAQARPVSPPSRTAGPRTTPPAPHAAPTKSAPAPAPEPTNPFLL